jgi:hypothetical protein
MTSFSLPTQSKQTPKASLLWCARGYQASVGGGRGLQLDHTPVMASVFTISNVTTNPEAAP